MVAAAGNAGVAQLNVPPPPPQVIVTTPWQLPIDLTTKVGKSLWDEGIKPAETKFTGYGKDLVRFLACVANQVEKCHWTNIVKVNEKSLLTQYGEITKEEVVTARNNRNKAPITSLIDARPKIDASMMYHYIYDSLDVTPQKKLSTKLNEIHQDGPTLLKYVLDDTYVATQAAIFTIKERFYKLNLKKYCWNVINLNQDGHEKCTDLVAAGHASDNTDIIISLFRAYNTSTNDEFKLSVSYWRNEWTSGNITTIEQLMTKADSRNVELRDLGLWRKKSPKDEQIVEFQAQVKELSKQKDNNNKNNNNNSNSTNTNDTDRRVPRWKFDRTTSNKETYERNGKTFRWCTGPGHQGKAMWVLHDPGKCEDRSKSS